MRKQLHHIPMRMFEVRLADHIFSTFLRFNISLKLYVKSMVSLTLEVGRCMVLEWRGGSEYFQGIQGHYPGRHAVGKIFA
jgi:hypothetical protein